MKKIKIVALMLACLLLFSGCSLVSRNEEAVAAQVVATVNGTEITRGEIDLEAEYYAMQYGIDTESTDDLMVAQYEMLKGSILDSVIDNELLLQNAEALGASITDEEKEENATGAQEMIQSLEDSFRSAVEAEAQEDDSIDVEAEVAARMQEYLDDTDFDMDEYVISLNEQDLANKALEKVYEQAEVDEADAIAKYEELKEAQQTEMDANPQALETYVQNENPYVYVAEDMIAVKHVLLNFEDEALVEQATTMYSEGDTSGALKLLDDEVDALMPAAEEIKQRLEDGELIDDLIQELGEDPGMLSGGSAIYGYLVGESTTSYLPEFSDAALGLTEVGDISDVVITYYGLHVLQCVATYEAGVIPYEDVQEQMFEAALPAIEQEVYSAQLETWREEADIVRYDDRLMN